MDAPLVATLAINPTEIDDEAHEMEIGYDYPLELYLAGEQIADANLKEILTIKNLLNTDKQFTSLGFNLYTTIFDDKTIDVYPINRYGRKNYFAKRTTR